MDKQLDQILKSFESAIKGAKTAPQLEELRVEFLGRKSGKLTNILKGLKDLSADEKKTIGKKANEVRQFIESALSASSSTQSTIIPHTDLSIPGIAPQSGHLHPRTLAINDLVDVFTSMGFMVYEGPELENDYYNFEALNFPESHPARDIQDTFFVKNAVSRKEKRELDSKKWLLRTQTSPMQVRLMEEFEPPLRAIVPGRTFRNEATDASHEHTFTQLEGLVVDVDISVGQLTWTLKEIFRQFYKQDVEVRLRPGYFPFVEPGYEIDMSCVFCERDGSYCKICKGTTWVEMGGSGMVHQNVFVAAGYERGTYTGFAFGMGPDRLAMLKYGIEDIRLLGENDLRFLEQF